MLLPEVADRCMDAHVAASRQLCGRQGLVLRTSWAEPWELIVHGVADRSILAAED